MSDAILRTSGSDRQNDFSGDDELLDPNYCPALVRKFYKKFAQGISPSASDSSTPKNVIAGASDNIVPSSSSHIPPELNERDLPTDISSESNSASSTHTSKKRKQRPDLWKCNIRKRLREHGQSYVGYKGKVFPAKTVGVRPACSDRCFYQCNKNFSEADRLEVKRQFWDLEEQEKKVFFGTFVKKIQCIKRRKKAEEFEANKKKYTYHYNLQVRSKCIQTCKLFFLNTLGISERKVYHYFNNIDEDTGAPKPSKLKNRGRKATDEGKRAEVKNHINSFPVLDSHYCRASSQQKYLESNLSVAKMYALYKEETSQPVSVNVYRHVFNYSFNLSFHRPKKDLCDKCYMYKSNKDHLDPKNLDAYKKHKDEKLFMKAERDVDRQNIDESNAIICFDLQNVFNLPIGYCSNFFYKRKLATFNLTATLILPNTPNLTYCAIWNETMNGRSGNEIASGLIKILTRAIADNPKIRRIILWSDSCVPQNRNQIMATALFHFLHLNSNIEDITQKFSEPGHSLVQEVDCVHSTIEKHLRHMEIGSPVSLIRQLNDFCYENVKLKIIQMVPSDFKLYSQLSSQLCFKQLPFSKCKFIKYQPHKYEIFYKDSGTEINYKSANLNKKGRFKKDIEDILKSKLTVAPSKAITSEKSKDLKSMIPFLKPDDRDFFNANLK